MRCYIFLIVYIHDYIVIHPEGLKLSEKGGTITRLNF